MGKGDRRSRRGKIWRGAHGKTRSHKDERSRARRRHGAKPSQIRQKQKPST